MNSPAKPKKIYKYKVSFVIPVYNAEKYVSETIESIIAQDIGFDNCEIILIDDGSKDESAKICKKYVSKYPKNIKYKYQKNSGPGAARNKGIEIANGEFINPIDSDDKLSPDAASEAIKFFEEHEEIDFVGMKWEFFEAKTGPHPLNYRFHESNRIVDLRKEYQDFQGSVAPAFFRSSILKQQIFDPRIGLYSEDGRYMAELLLKNPKYGALSKPTYYYRKRLDQTSSQDKNQTDKFWYLKTPKLVWLDLFERARQEEGEIPKFLQYMAMYDIQWRIKQSFLTPLSESEREEYRDLIKTLLKNIEDNIILEQRNIYSEHKLFALNLKYDYKLPKSLFVRKANKVFIGNSDIALFDYSNNGFHIEIIENTEKDLIFEGKTRGLFEENANLYLKIIKNDSFVEYVRAEKVTRPHSISYSLDQSIYDGGGFKLVVAKEKIINANLVPVVEHDDKETVLKMTSGLHARLPEYFKFGISYLVKDDILITRLRHSLFIAQNNKSNLLKKEIKLFTLQLPLVLLRVLKSRASSSIQRRTYFILKEAHQVIYANFIRFLYYATKPFVKKQIWIVTDRIKWADDNGEVFFNYLQTQPNNRFTAYFAIDKNTEDYKRIKNISKNVIHYFGIKHQVLSLHADKFISSEATNATLNTLNERYGYLQGLLKYDFVFLQHGIIRDDLSGWVNRYNKNIKLFVTSAPAERKSILNNRYGYEPKNVVLTGLPRLDNLLEDNSQKKRKLSKIAIMPTWRSNIIGETSAKTNIRAYNPDFKASEFYKYYSKLLNDKEINKSLKDHNLKIDFCLHHAMQAQIKDFESTDYVNVAPFPHDYKKIKKESAALVTDYSSLAFDFAYMQKPVIYSQFDEDTFYDNNPSGRGYFDYRKDGFGPVCSDFESTKKAIISLIKSNFKIDDKYVERTQEFFYRIDGHNCRRVYQAILEMDDRDEHIERSVIKNSASYKVEKIKTYWWRYRAPSELNFGDEITPYIVKSLFGSECEYADPSEASLAGAGSILHILNEKAGGNAINIWGSGFIDKNNSLSKNKKFIFHAVRGGLTLEKLGANNKLPLGDPGLLASRVFKRSKKVSYKIGIVPHYVDFKNNKVKEFMDSSEIYVIDPLQTPDKVALDISSCEMVFSSSLHGLIFADSFDVPNYWMPLSEKVAGGDFKFSDYFSSVGRDFIKVSPEVLYDEKEIERLKKQYKKIPNLKKIQQDLIESFPFGNK